MALRKSQVLLPDLFQTNKNSKFLNATVDQLISEPNLQRINGYIGRQSAKNFTVGDSYISEIDNDRQNYQLEPAVVYRGPDKSIQHLTGYQDFIAKLRYNNVDVLNHSDLFNQEYYNYSGFVDLDKLINYGEYFWLPAGPDSVQVFNNIVDKEKDYTVFRDGTTYRQVGLDEVAYDAGKYDETTSDIATGDAIYRFDSATADPNPTLILARGGTYTFKVVQPGIPFWIQTEPGTSGVTGYSKNTSTREVLGVTNNGVDDGTVTFIVPEADAQNDKINAVQSANPDFATTLTYKQIHNVPLQNILDEYDGIDGQTEIDGKSLVFINTTNDETAWDQGALFDAYGFDDPDHPFDQRTTLPMDTRYDVYAIEVKNVGGTNIVQLRRDSDWPVATKVKIKQGNNYGNREFYKDASGLPEIIKPYTAGIDTLYYQDGQDANRFGRIKLVEIDTVSPIDVIDDIIGKQSYTSNNGVKLTNGLKIEFNSDATPSTYADKEFYVEGVGQPAGIDLVPVHEMLTPETYTVSTSDGYDTVAYDSGGFDGTLNAPTTQDYIIINRSSPDRNAWSRGNRWFHREVIEATATYNGYTATIDDNSRAKRPIIEFNRGLDLFNMGISSVAPVTVIDSTQTDALSNVNGTAGYFADGIDIQQDNTVIFSADTDADVRTKIYRVDFIDQDSSISTNEIINLVEIGTVVDGNCVLSTLGANNQGKQFWLDDTTWKTAQQKTKINQDPLFDVFDPDHTSFSDQTKYPSSNFVGNKLFSYKRNNNVSPDTILNFGLSYQNFSQIGDIVFENNFDKETFQYTRVEGNVDVIIRSGHVHGFDRDGNRTLVNGWTKIIEPSVQYQIVKHDVNSELYSFEIGAPVDTTKVRQPLQVFVNGDFISPTEYTHLIQSYREYVVFKQPRSLNDTITIKFFSATKAANSFYAVPDNLENNAGNATFGSLTLGQLRNHTIEITNQIKPFVGEAPGKSNLRDLNYRAYKGKILQHSAGMILPSYVLNSEKADVVSSINYVKNEYTKFKNNFIQTLETTDLDLTNPAKCVDDILENMNNKKTSVFPFYYSDMLPYGNQKTQLVYTIDDITETEFEFRSQFDLTSISNRAVLVYHNNNLLLEGRDYTFDTTEAKVVLTTSGGAGLSTIGIAINDTITIVEYSDTDGSFAPPTPTKLGLYNKFIPRKYTDNTYKTPKQVVLGHDGSIWVGYGDIRDDIIFELEKRIYNNIKTQYNRDLFDFSNVIPGYYRSTIENFAEANNITRSYFGEWSLRNRVKIQTNTLSTSDDLFSWNYRNSVNKLDGSRVPGYWRGMYKWVYDTDTPHTTPWEMLGVTVKPTWWDDRYGEAPYTFGNTVLWEDLRDGKLYNDAVGTDFTTLVRYQRPTLMDIIPVTEQGELKAPADFLVRDAFSTNINSQWAYSDQSPGETAWRRSSEFPFVMQILAANILPAQYCTLMFDTNLYANDSEYDQILQKGKSYRPGIADFHMHGMVHTGQTDIMRVEGYNQFISEYVKHNGFAVNAIVNEINNLELNLCYGMAGFTDKNYIKVVAESVSPGSSSENIFIPDEDLTIYTKKSAPLERVVYSGVQIIKRTDGYEIQGYDIENPFFKIIPSVQNNEFNQRTLADLTFIEYKGFESRIINIPYGTIITTPQQVFDFLVGYQRYLVSRGFVFNQTNEDGQAFDFVNAGMEYAFWLQQGWNTDSVFVISPCFDKLTINRQYTTVDNIQRVGKIKDANAGIIKTEFYDVSRIDNQVEISVDIENTQLYSVQVDPVQHEHVLVFNNKTIFNDVIYQPELGNRQERLKLIGSRSGDWNGTLHAPGFFLSDDAINVWQSYVDYRKGDIVSYQNVVYVAKVSHSGTQVFDYNQWLVADKISTGMLKNLTTKANQFKDFFDLDSLNLEDGVDKLGKGIIGFNNKDYLQGLNLDDVSQVKFYQGLITQKGTGSAINKLIDAELTNLDQEIDYFEEWAFRVGEYGSIDSNQIIETIIPEQDAANNPFLLHFHADGDKPATDNGISGHLHVQGKDLFKRPNNYNGNVFGVRNANSLTLNDLDSAGYARLDDVDFTLFNGDQLETLSTRINELGKGKKIWFATDDTNTWGMRRIDEMLSTITDVQSTTNGFLIYTTDRNHGLVENDYVIVRSAAPIGRVAKVHSVESPSKFAIKLTSAAFDIALSDVRIPMYKLSSVRFSQASDIFTFTPVSGWDNQELVWVDKNKSGDWEVLQNTKPWSSTGTKTQSPINALDKFGTGLAINREGTLAVAGAPDSGTGLIIPYVRSESGPLAEGNSVSTATIGDSVNGFGFSLGVGNDYVAVGAPETQSSAGAVFVYYVDSAGTFNKRPAIRPSDVTIGDQFGYSLTMSGNGRHLFVGAPGGNKIYAYALVDIASTSERSFTVTTDGGASYTLDFTPINIQALDVTDENGKVYLPNKDFTLSGADITFTSTPSSGLDIVIRQQDYFVQVAAFAGHDTMPGDKFGFDVDTDYYGRYIVVGAPDAAVANSDSTVLSQAGEAYVFAQTVERFIADGTSKSFTTADTLQTKIFVEVDDVLQIETDNTDVPTDNEGSTDGFYTRTSNTITFKTTPIAGSKIVVYTGSFSEKQKLDQNIVGETIVTEEQFGKSVSIDTNGTMVAIGTPGEDETNPNTGSVFIFQDSGKNYGTVTSNATHSQTAGDVFYINDYKITVGETGSNPTGIASDINLANIPGVSASVNSSGQIVISTTETLENNRLTVNPGSGQLFQRDKVFQPFVNTQKINHPNAFENENFGNKVMFDKHFGVGVDAQPGTRNLVIASDRASTLLGVGFDIDTNSNSESYLEAITSFDQKGTTFTDKRTQSGAAYVYELLDANSPTISNPHKLVFGQQLKSTNIQDLDEFGGAIAFSDNRIIVGAPGDTTTSGSNTYENSGSIYEFNNNDRTSAWRVYRNQENRVDVNLINRVALYNKKSGEISVFLDYIDPAKGKIAGIAQSELTYVTHNDPAMYNNWNQKQEYRLWWDTSTVHYLNAEQGDLDFRTNYWGVTFPGSSIDVYEWIMSDVPPEQYTGAGTVKDITKFATVEVFDSTLQDTKVRYFFWVKGRTSVPREAEFRNISADSVTKIIENPKAQGIPYLAFFDTDAVALYNCKSYFKDSDVVLSINYDVVKNEGVLHSEFELFGKGNTDQNIPTRMYNKLVDSLAGSDSVGNLVPDPYLSDVEKYGVLTQPRQGLFVNRAAAIKVMTQYCNNVFATAPFARFSNLSTLFGSEPLPTVDSGEYDTKVNTVQERDFLNTAILTTGYKVLVLEDENNNDYWSVYTLQSDSSWLLTNIQGYNTADYWNYTTYYASGYDETTVPKYQVTLEADLLSLSDAEQGDIAKVTSNDEGNFSMFVKNAEVDSWTEVIIERGTIQLSDNLYDFSKSNVNFESTGFDNGGFDFSAFDKVPSDEIRQIITAIKNEIFVDTYKINMNEMFFRLVEYALNETTFTEDWVFKTSFITVAHKIRSLDQYSTFKFDNTTFIENFIEEVKPYKTKIREYVSKYDKLDTYDSDTTDFDIHAFYDETNQYFRKPSGEYVGDEILRTQGLNQPWSENYGYKLDNIVIVNAGTGYLDDPTITISAPQLVGGVQATATAKTNGSSIVSVSVTNKGSGYTSNPTITIAGSGSDLKLSPRLLNETIRGFDSTIKFDRISYSSNIKDWTANTAYSTGDVIAYQNTVTKTQEVYTAQSNFTSGATFSVEDANGFTVLEVALDEDFTNSADRIAAYYYPTSGMIGDDLELLQRGTGYLGNKVSGAGFDQNPGFDSSNFDTIAFDNFEIDSDGLAVLAGLDTNISSLFTDIELGTRPEDINVDGAGFVDTYNSHAPEELIPGRVYDTLDMEVYTHASNDYEKDGNSPDIRYTSYTDTTASKVDFQFGDPTKSSDDFIYLIVYKNSERVYNFTVDYESKEVVLSSPLTATDILHIYAYGVTGEKLVGEYTYQGDGSTTAFVLSNVQTLTQQALVFVDGVETTTTIGSQDNRSLVTFTTAPDNGAQIHVFTFNQETSRDAPSRIALQTETMTAGTFTYSLDNTVNYAQPFGANTVVEIDNVRLRPVNSKYHTGDGSTVQFAIATTANETTISNISDIGVAVIQQSTNTTLNAVRNIDYTVTSGDAFVTLTTAPAQGDTVIVYNRADAEYTISADGAEITIDSAFSFTSSSVMRINTFANHDPLRIQTKVYVGQGTGSTTIIDEFDEVGFDSAGFDRTTVSGTVGTYAVDRPVANVNNFWVTVDGIRLHPGDYITNGSEIIMSSAVQATITGTSVVIITHISENTIQPSIGFRIFKDMNDNVEYLRLSKDATTEVAQPIDITDDKIFVQDASVLPFVTADSEFPGVVFIGNERITYREVSLEDNYISGLRRGTGGTQIYLRIEPGFLVVDGSREQRLPATDTDTKTWYDLGSGVASDGLGLQQSTTVNANFLKESEAQVPNYRLELNEKLYMVADYVEDDYVEELL